MAIGNGCPPNSCYPAIVRATASTMLFGTRRHRSSSGFHFPLAPASSSVPTVFRPPQACEPVSRTEPTDPPASSYSPQCRTETDAAAQLRERQAVNWVEYRMRTGQLRRQRFCKCLADRTAGSMLEWFCIPLAAAVAQLVVAPDCGSGSRGFKPHQPPQNKPFIISRP